MSINNPSLYPGGLDSYTNLPLAIPLVTEINEDLVNTLIDAVLRLEHAVGPNPAGSLTNLVDRLAISMNADGTLKPIPINLVHAEAFQDRNIILSGGGNISWDSSTSRLTWDANLVVGFPVSGSAPTLVAPQTVILPAAYYVLAVRISRSGVPQLKPAVVGSLADPSLNDNDAVILAVRDATGRIYWRNGSITESGNTQSFAQIYANRIVYRPGGTNFAPSITDAQAALTNLDTRVINNNNTTTTTIGVKEVESISRDNSLQVQISDMFPNADRNLFMLGGGNFSLDGYGTLSFTQDIVIYQTTLSGDAIIGFASQSPISLPAVGSVAYVSIDRTATSDYGVNVTVGTPPIPNQSSVVILAVRTSTTSVRLFNGDMIFSDSLLTPYSEGKTSARNVVFDNTIVPLAGNPANVQAALDAVHTALNTLSGTVGTSHFVPTDAVIMMLGSACPPGYTAMPELQNLFIRGGLTGSTAPVGSNTHAHTGATNSAGDHTHGVGSLALQINVWNQHLSGGGFETDSFTPGTGSGGDLTSNPVSFPLSGSLAVAGAHTHTLTTDSQSHIPQYAAMLMCRAN